ncbi:hypothetical protein [Halorhabdus salina]|uniref:hypothetical protein n=1 Tax=Halorhabdus salina TaxID=2750670 RepID=UPI0015EE749C|nr:hypothetical protein [Halorhabdus salina]
MPNRDLDLHPRFERDKPINADVIDTEIGVVSSNGYLNIGSENYHHMVAWAPFESGATLRTRTVSGKGREDKQTFVQEGDGNVNIGPGEEWEGRQVVAHILDKTISDS